MILCLDIGNTQIHGGVFQRDELYLQFRKNTFGGSSSDEIGLFLREVLVANELDPKAVKHIAVCTVVPEVLHSVSSACLKYFKIKPLLLQPGVKTSLTINYRSPSEVGADRIANAIAALHLYPDTHLIVVDFGTATTFCAIHKERKYCGGVIIPGLKIAMRSLESNTSKLPAVDIGLPDKVLGRSTVESIQSGLYYSTMGAVREITARLKQEVFSGEEMKVVATGGFSSLFAKTSLFDAIVPDLALKGLYLTWKMNH